MVRNSIFLPGFFVALLAVSGDALNRQSQCVWEQVQLGSDTQVPLKFNGTPVGWKGDAPLYWGWYVDPNTGFMAVTVNTKGEVEGIAMPTSNRQLMLIQNLENSNIRINVLHCTGDDYRLGDQAVDLRWVPYTSTLDLNKCVGLTYDHECRIQSMYVARAPNAFEAGIAPNFFRPYYGVAIQIGYAPAPNTKFDLLCEVSPVKSLKK